MQFVSIRCVVFVVKCHCTIAAYTVVRGGVAKLGGINSTARYNQNYASSSCVMGLVGRSDTML